MGNTIANPNWYPQISGKVDKAVEDAIRLSYDNSYKLSAQVGALASAIQSLQSQVVAAQGSNADTQAQLSNIQSLFSLVGLSVSPVGYPIGFDGNQIAPIQINTGAVVNSAISDSGLYIDATTGNTIIGTEQQVGSVSLTTNGGYGVVFAKIVIQSATSTTHNGTVYIRKDTLTGTVIDNTDFSIIANDSSFGMNIAIDPSPSPTQTYIFSLSANSTVPTWGNVRVIALNIKR